jgi:hypothetical protein
LPSLLHLKHDERFCSIDEFGPVAIKQRGGRRLAGPDEHPTVPQFQSSKGTLPLTAALELSTNQVTHFYSGAKNTQEMIKLLDVLLRKYRYCKTLNLSWDAASWHASKAFLARVGEVNSPRHRIRRRSPFVRLAPLPARAQFLNVIESVFSGLLFRREASQLLREKQRTRQDVGAQAQEFDVRLHAKAPRRPQRHLEFA